MKPTYYGVPSAGSDTMIVSKPTEEVNIPLLEQAIGQLSTDPVHTLSNERLDYFERCVQIYKLLFKYGYIPIEELDHFSNEIIEIARESLDDEMANYITKPSLPNGFNYFYEYCRAIAVEEQVGNLTEFLDEECDFI